MEVTERERSTTLTMENSFPQSDHSCLNGFNFILGLNVGFECWEQELLKDEFHQGKT